MKKTKDKILDIAEAGIRGGGFSSISFREIAKALSIKSASVHYHFPTKSDLGEAVVKRYQDAVLEALGKADNPDESPKARIERLANVYITANSTGPCLCVVLGSVMPDLPQATQQRVNAYFESILDWIMIALGSSEKSKEPAEAILSLLQGSMVLAMGRDEQAIVNRVANQATRLIPWGLRVEAKL